MNKVDIIYIQICINAIEYIYIYICVCVCMCMWEGVWSSQTISISFLLYIEI